jgi:hypothetical protein
MIKSHYIKLTLIAVLLSAAGALTVFAQESDQAVKATIIRQDSLFWQAYNTCNTAVFNQFFSEDVEFYHDKGGITMGLPALIASFKKGACSETNAFRLRREAVEGSYKAFLLKKNDTIYGAILSGEHLFYVVEKGKDERLDGLAKFTHLWMLKDGAWKMTRVLSYDHGPAPYRNKRTAIALPAAALQRYAGKYKGPKIGTLDIAATDSLLIMHIGDKQFQLVPEKENLFFSKERDLTFEFIKGSNGRTAKLIVRESGNVAEELEAIP